MALTTLLLLAPLPHSKEKAINSGYGSVYTLRPFPNTFSFTIIALLMDYTTV